MDLLVTPAGPTVVPDDVVQPSTGSVGCSPIPLKTPAVPTLGKKLLFQNQPWVDPSSAREPADYRLPAAPLTSRPATTSQHVDDIDTVREHVNVPDLSREGPFDIHRGHQHSGASLRLRQDNQGCPFRLASYDAEEGGPDMVFSFMICTCWNMWVPQSRLVYLAVAQSTGSSTWGGRNPSLPHCSYSMMLD